MRRFLITASAVLVVISLIGITAGVALARSGSYLPGDTLFMLQYYAEQQQIRWYANKADRAERYLGLLERRLENLVKRTGSSHEIDSLIYLDDALDQAIRAVIEVPDDSEGVFQERLLSLVVLSEVAVHRLSVAPTQNPQQFASFSAKLSTIRVLTSDTQFAFETLLSRIAGDLTDINLAQFQGGNPPGSDQAQVNPINVPFPEGSLANQHDFYPLVGEHTQLECTACHSDGVYDGTPNWCEACHGDDKPAEHFIGDCGSCHTPVSWEDANFDHSLVGTTECLTCHSDEKPSNHYGNQCSACHYTNAWTPADFNHKVVGAVDCVSCHSTDKPVNHYDGQCSNCHNTDNWRNVNFNHSGQTNCQSCHSGDRPSGHYDGQCSSCHDTNNWRNVNFNHSGQTNCQSCHSGDRPSGHYDGQCSSCHNTNNWQNASFNHSGQTNCQSCHSGDKPSGHFSGQCSQCHNTNDWDDASFNHSAQKDCISCHAGDRPREHSNKQCSQCHNQRDWDDADDDDEGDGSDHGDDDEEGSTDSIITGVFAGSSTGFDCSACHSNNETTGKLLSTSPLASGWQNFMEILLNEVDV